MHFLNIAISLIMLMPPSPELIEKSKSEGWFNYIKKTLLNAHKKGVDAPDFNKLKKIRNLMQEAHANRHPLNIQGIVILTEFTDNHANTPPEHYDTLLFSYTDGQHSQRDYYLENSYGYLDITGDISGWYTMPHNYTYYSNNNGFGTYPSNAQGLVEDAVLAADPYVDFSQYDFDNDGFVDILFVVHAGPGAEQTGNPNHIWSHRWSLPSPLLVDGVYVYDYSMEPENGKVGVFSHELGHVFGLPDLYDYDYDSQGLGDWSIMAGGSWGNGGNTPVHFDAWSKYMLGFVTPVNVTGHLEDVPIYRVEDNPVVYRLWRQGNTGPQYFLIENRRSILFDSYIPAEGLLVYHVDDLQNGNSHQWYPGHTSSGHYKVALEQADANWDLERNINGGDDGDPFPGSTNSRRFDNSSWPDSRDYSSQFTHVRIYNISDQGDTMFVDMDVNPVQNVALRRISSPSGIIFSDSSITPSVWVGNFGSGSVAPSVTLKILNNGQEVYSSSASGSSLNPGDTVLLTFQNFVPPVSNTEYNVVAYSTNMDQYPVDDTVTTTYTPFVIVDTISLLSPGSDVTIDGTIDETEWNDATIVDISDIANSGGGPSPSPVGTSLLYIKHNGSDLLLGIKDKVNGIDVNVHRLSLIFDDNGSGSFPEPGNTQEGEISISGNPSGSTPRFTPMFSSGNGTPSTIPLDFAINTTDSTFEVEVRIPLEYAPIAEDWAIGVYPPTHSLCMFIYHRIMNPNLGAIAWYPQDVPMTEYNNPSLYVNVILGGLTVGVEEPGSHSHSKNLPVLLMKNGKPVLLWSEPTPGEYTFSIFNVAGQKVRTKDIIISKSRRVEIPVANEVMPEGVFFGIFHGKGVFERFKFIEIGEVNNDRRH